MGCHFERQEQRNSGLWSAFHDQENVEYSSSTCRNGNASQADFIFIHRHPVVN